ncbi:hypothetical protein, partial [Lacticaseibacillus camelliae]|uniref:hypothetical protein n=1 Tax=Lacticaseibacillus camelliae TaxID=381742 RepID=UPI000A59AB66
KKYFQFTGKKFSQVLAETRMKQAAEMLKQNYQINEVASESGSRIIRITLVNNLKKLYGITLISLRNVMCHCRNGSTVS